MMDPKRHAAIGKSDVSRLADRQAAREFLYTLPGGPEFAGHERPRRPNEPDEPREIP